MRASGNLQRFKDFIERRGVETGAWRGSIGAGQERGSGTGSPDIGRAGSGTGDGSGSGSSAMAGI